MGYYETYEEGKERWVAEPGDPVNIHGVSYDPNDPWSNWVNAAGQLDVPGWQENLDNAQRLVEEQGLPFGANEQRGGFSRFFNPSTGEWPIEYHARQENAGPFGLPSWTAPLFALAAVGTAGAGSALLGPAAGAAGAAGAGSAAAPAAASAASILGIPTSTLSTIGTIGSIGGTAANVLGGLTDQEWLQKLGMGLSVAGGLAGGVAGLGNVLNTGVSSIGDVARLASSAGKITGAIGRIPGAEALGDVSKYLDVAGKLGSGIETISDVFGDGVTSLKDAARLASGAGQVTGALGRVTGHRGLQQASRVLSLGSRLGGNVQNFPGASQQAQRRGVQPQSQRTTTAPQRDAPMTDADWLKLDLQTGPWQQAMASVLGNL